MKRTLFILALSLLTAPKTYGMSERHVAAATPTRTETYKITDGYGTYTGQGSTKLAAKEGARTGCVTEKLNYYQMVKGELPTDDVYDSFIDACINK